MTIDESENKDRASARREQKKKQIAMTALELIADLGVENITLRKVGSESNYHPASLYEYFSGKDELLEYVSELAREEFMKYLNVVIDDTRSVEETLIELGTTYLHYAKEKPKHFQVMFISLKQNWATFDPLADNSPIKFLVTAIQKGINNGQLVLNPNINAFDVAYHLWSIVHGMALLQQTFFLEYNYDWDTTNEEILKKTISLYTNKI